jgi:SAM-dependent methyltransferase
MEHNPHWFKDWFNSPYYHQLYKNRNIDEAEFFLENILELIKLNATDKICDLACGKGRHSLYLNKKGYHVTGLDIASESIDEANKYANTQLNFAVHDMRNNFGSNRFQAVFNLFTSFGYFNSLKENEKVLKNIYMALKPGGILVLDFFNATKVKNCIIPNEIKTIDDIDFKISKYIQNGKIYKEIAFNANQNQYLFREEVQLISKKDFVIMLQNHNFAIENLKGNYKLEEFNEHDSDRLIIIARKN